MDGDGIIKFCKPMFCRHLYRRRNFESMQIPTEFLDRVKEKVPDAVILKGPWGGSWPVKVCQKEDGVFLVGGWKKFLSDHSLVSGGFLLFRYGGNWCFNAEIFGHDGLEKSKTLDSGEKSETDPSSVTGKRGKHENHNLGSPTQDQVSKSRPAGSGVQNKNKRRANWKDPELVEMFLDLCMQEAAIGRTDGGNLSRESWDKIQGAFKQVKGIDLTKVQLENHWNFLKGKYMAWSKIVAQAITNGEYDPGANTVNWYQHQWVEYVQLHPEAKVFRYKSLDHPEKMKLLFHP